MLFFYYLVVILMAVLSLLIFIALLPVKLKTNWQSVEINVCLQHSKIQ